MRGSKGIALAGLMLAAFLAAGCGGGQGEPPEVKICGEEIVVGESEVSELKEKGFTINDMGAMLLEMPKKSWTSAIYLEKDGVSYASIAVVNDSSEAKAVDDCHVEEIGFYGLNEEGRELDITIDGINPVGMTQEELKEAYPDLELDEEEGDFLFHYLTDGEYSVCFEYCYGELTDIDVTHDFNKSYSSK